MLLHWPRALHSFPPTVAIQLPFPHCPLCPSVSPPLLFPLLALSLCLYLWDTTLGRGGGRGPTPTAFWLLQKLLAALAEEDASTACTARLLLLMFYYPQQIKIASFCPAQCKSCLVMPTSEAGVQFNARHSINCPAEGRRSFNEMTQPQPQPEPESIHRNGLKMKTSRNTLLTK